MLCRVYQAGHFPGALGPLGGCLCCRAPAPAGGEAELLQGRPAGDGGDPLLGCPYGYPPGQAGGGLSGAGHDAPTGGQPAPGHLLRLPDPPGAVHRGGPGGAEGQVGAAPRGHLPLHRHSLLPHPLCLLQLCVPGGGKELRPYGAVPGGAAGGNHPSGADGGGPGPAH